MTIHDKLQNRDLFSFISNLIEYTIFSLRWPSVSLWTLALHTLMEAQGRGPHFSNILFNVWSYRSQPNPHTPKCKDSQLDPHGGSNKSLRYYLQYSKVMIRLCFQQVQYQDMKTLISPEGNCIIPV